MFFSLFQIYKASLDMSQLNKELLYMDSKDKNESVANMRDKLDFNEKNSPEYEDEKTQKNLKEFESPKKRKHESDEISSYNKNLNPEKHKYTLDNTDKRKKRDLLSDNNSLDTNTAIISEESVLTQKELFEIKLFAVLLNNCSHLTAIEIIKLKEAYEYLVVKKKLNIVFYINKCFTQHLKGYTIYFNNSTRFKYLLSYLDFIDFDCFDEAVRTKDLDLQNVNLLKGFLLSNLDYSVKLIKKVFKKFENTLKNVMYFANKYNSIEKKIQNEMSNTERINILNKIFKENKFYVNFPEGRKIYQEVKKIDSKKMRNIYDYIFGMIASKLIFREYLFERRIIKSTNIPPKESLKSLEALSIRCFIVLFMFNVDFKPNDLIVEVLSSYFINYFYACNFIIMKKNPYVKEMVEKFFENTPENEEFKYFAEKLFQLLKKNNINKKKIKLSSSKNVF